MSHLFVAFDLGSRCACGRKAFAFEGQSEQPGFRDVPQEQMSPALLAACIRLNGAGTPHVWKAVLLLALGDSVIRDARKLRADCAERRRRPHIVIAAVCPHARPEIQRPPNGAPPAVDVERPQRALPPPG